MLKNHVFGVLLVTLLLKCHQVPCEDILEYGVTKNEIIVSIKDTDSPYKIDSYTCTAVDDTDPKICENLDPCRVYNVTTFLSLKETSTIVPNEISTESPPESGIEDNIVRHQLKKTSKDIPEYWIENIEVHEENLLIFWDAANKYCISEFAYEVKNQGDSKQKEGIKVSENPINVEGLHPCQIYTVNLTAKTDDPEVVECKSDKKCSDEIELNYKEPGNLTNISATNDTNSVKITWENPGEFSCIKNYTIFYKTVEAEKWETKNIKNQITNQYIFNNLDGCEQYQIDVIVNVDLETFDFSLLETTSQIFQSAVTVPTETLTLEIVSNISTITKMITAIVNWEKPKNHSKCVQFYRIQISLEDDVHEIRNVTATETSTEFYDLYPCTSYEFLLTPFINESEFGKTTNVTEVLENVQPDRVENIQYTPLPHQLNLTWDTPKVTKNCVFEYRITGWATDDPTNNEYKFESKTEQNLYLAKDLISCLAYTIQIIPVGNDNKDGNPYQVQFEAMPVKEENVELEATWGSHSIDLIVKTNDATNLCPSLFIKFSCYTQTKDDIPYKKAEIILPVVNSINKYTQSVQPLSPNTEYICTGSVFNPGGWGDSVSKRITTDKYFPSAPRNVTANNITPTMLNYTWNIPRYPNGVISIYHMIFEDLGPAYFQPNRCTDQKVSPKNLEQVATVKSFDKLQPFNKYSFQVCASHTFIGEYSDALITVTEPDQPPPVEKLKITIYDPDNSTEEYSAKIKLDWDIPCITNGKIEMFILEFSGERDGFSDNKHSFKRKVCANGKIFEDGNCYNTHPNENGSVFIEEANLLPDYNYNVDVTIKNEDVEDRSPINFLKFQSPSGIPEMPTFRKVGVKETEVPSSSIKVEIQVDQLNDENGIINRSALLVSEIGCDDEELANQKIFDYCTETKPCPKPLTWSEASQADCVKQYQTTNEDWNIIGVTEKDASSKSGSVSFTIGVEKCEIDQDFYCNGPLKPSTEYNVTLRIYTKNSYRDIHIDIFITQSLIRLYVIVFSILGCLLVAFIGGFMYLWISKQQIWRKDSINNEDQTGDISSKNFELHYYHISNREKLQREFKELQVVAVDLSVTASRLNENRNRYSNIFPYDKNRVILDIDSDGSDYINASFINGYRKRKEYIATQGPKLDTAIDFWRMVIQHNVKVIAMVTQIKEGDIIKCHRYFPMGQMKYMKFGKITVMLTSETSDDLLERREFCVKHSGDGFTRNVVHYYFKKWPDHDCPADPEDLISFVKKIKSEKKSSHSPIVVHCSAGVGRTGTLIGLDIIMQRLKHESKINIFETVKELRFQRMKMVQTIQQYTFLYTCTYQLLLQKKNSRNFAFKKEKPNKKTVSFKTDLVEGSHYIENGQTISIGQQQAPSAAESDL